MLDKSGRVAMRSWESVAVILPHLFEFLFTLRQAGRRTRRSSGEVASPQGKSVRCVSFRILDRSTDREFLKFRDRCRYVSENRGTVLQCDEQSWNVHEN